MTSVPDLCRLGAIVALLVAVEFLCLRVVHNHLRSRIQKEQQ